MRSHLLLPLLLLLWLAALPGAAYAQAPIQIQRVYPEPGGFNLLIERQCPDLPSGADDQYADGFHGKWRVLTLGAQRVLRGNHAGRFYRSRLVAEGELGTEVGEGKYAQGMCPAFNIHPHNTDEVTLLADDIPSSVHRMKVVLRYAGMGQPWRTVSKVLTYERRTAARGCTVLLGDPTFTEGTPGNQPPRVAPDFSGYFFGQWAFANRCGMELGIRGLYDPETSSTAPGASVPDPGQLSYRWQLAGKDYPDGHIFPSLDYHRVSGSLTATDPAGGTISFPVTVRLSRDCEIQDRCLAR